MLAAAFASLVVPEAIEFRPGRPQAKDEQVFHLPAIRQFSAQLPSPDFQNYSSATGPAYHLMLAVVHRMSGGGLGLLRGINALVGFGLVVVVWLGAARFAGGRPILAAALSAPLLACAYAVGSSIWLSTDNAGLALALISVWLAISAPLTPWRAILAGVFSAGAVSIRQLAVWTLAPLVVAGFRKGERAAWIGCIPAPLVLGTLVLIWEGAVPPAFRKFHAGGWNAAAVPYGLALLGFWSIWLLPAALSGTNLRAWLAERRRALLVVIGAAALVAIVPHTNRLMTPDELSPFIQALAEERAAMSAPTDPTTHPGKHADPGPDSTSASAAATPPKAAGATGRWGGFFWSAVVGRTPEFANRSPVLIAFAILGAVATFCLWDRAVRAGHARAAMLMVVVLVAFLLAQSLNSQTFQRYFDPFFMAWLAWFTAVGARTGDSRHERCAILGATVIAMAQLVLTLGTIYGGDFALLTRLAGG